MTTEGYQYATLPLDVTKFYNTATAVSAVSLEVLQFLISPLESHKVQQAVVE